MDVLLVVESLFGNTREVAEAVAEGLRTGRPSAGVEVLDVADAPAVVPRTVTVMLVGGPTHTFSMSHASTRSDAVAKGAREGSDATGIREWLDSVTPRPDLDVVTFDTRVKVKGIPGSAAKSAAKAFRKRGFTRARRGETFWVEETAGPLRAGERERAVAWGHQLGTGG